MSLGILATHCCLACVAVREIARLETVRSHLTQTLDEVKKEKVSPCEQECNSLVTVFGRGYWNVN